MPVPPVFVSGNAAAFYGPSYDSPVIDSQFDQPSEHVEDLDLSLYVESLPWETKSSGSSPSGQEGIEERQLAGLDLNTHYLEVRGYESFDWISASTVHVGSTSTSDEDIMGLANKLLREWTTIEV